MDNGLLFHTKKWSLRVSKENPFTNEVKIITKQPIQPKLSKPLFFYCIF